jgi:hypothetical protein
MANVQSANSASLVCARSQTAAQTPIVKAVRPVNKTSALIVQIMPIVRLPIVTL